eukprot:GCRY01006175.1.p1 GENE.GCRY01006175.1~~GCRY01006175.1.p1  ORF type:complete len:374 (+),score=17.48 GCRY01006175.1:199-1320(+)
MRICSFCKREFSHGSVLHCSCRFKCVTCGTAFAKSSLNAQHRTHTIICSCGQVFDSSSSFNKHYGHHHTEDVSPCFKCLTCERAVSSKSLHNNHKTHTILCFCGQVFGSFWAFSRHVHHHHQQESPWTGGLETFNSDESSFTRVKHLSNSHEDFEGIWCDFQLVKGHFSCSAPDDLHEEQKDTCALEAFLRISFVPLPENEKFSSTMGSFSIEDLTNHKIFDSVGFFEGTDSRGMVATTPYSTVLFLLKHKKTGWNRFSFRARDVSAMNKICWMLSKYCFFRVFSLYSPAGTVRPHEITNTVTLDALYEESKHNERKGVEYIPSTFEEPLLEDQAANDTNMEEEEVEETEEKKVEEEGEALANHNNVCISACA